MDTTIVCYFLFLIALVVSISIFLFKFRNNLLSYFAFAIFYLMVVIWVAFNYGRDIFDALNMVCIAFFLGGLYLLVFSSCITWKKFKALSLLFLILALLVVGTGVDAFFIEPKWLEITRMKIRSSKVPRYAKIAIISDVQTDQVGEFEDRILKKVMNEKPDMIVFPGDFIQTTGPEQHRQMQKLNKLLTSNKLAAPLGIYVTEGDTEALLWQGNTWKSVFEGLSTTCFDESSTVSNSDFAITGLTLKDSSNLNYSAPDTDLYHIWIGHRPDYALDNPDADLMIAGHTHGGQVQIPMWGPVFTFSRVPRNLGAGGLFEVSKNKNLVISRGLGMERGFAPRMRFLCRPQLVILELIPEFSSG